MPISAAGCNWPARRPREGGGRAGASLLSGPGLRRGDERGFTLVELMVVLVLIGAMTAVVMFALPDPRGNLREEAVRLAARAHAARDEAILSSRPIRLRVDASGYAFDKRRSGVWTAITDKPFAPQPWTPGVVIAAPVQVTFEPAGGALPRARVTLVRDTTRMNVSIAADGAISVEG